MRFAGEIMIDGIGAKIYIFKNLFSETTIENDKRWDR